MIRLVILALAASAIVAAPCQARRADAEAGEALRLREGLAPWRSTRARPFLMDHSPGLGYADRLHASVRRATEKVLEGAGRP